MCHTVTGVSRNRANPENCQKKKYVSSWATSIVELRAGLVDANDNQSQYKLFYVTVILLHGGLRSDAISKLII